MFETFLTPDIRPAAAECFIVFMALVLMMADLVIRRNKPLIVFAATQLTLLCAATIQLETSSGQVVYTFSNMFVDDLMAGLLKLFLYLTVSCVLFYSRTYVEARESMARTEFYVLTLFATLGMMVMISANHFITIYLGIELLSLSLYAMVAMNRDHLPSTEAAMKYFVLGAMASGILLYGMSMIYGATGTLEITAIASRLTMGGNTAVLVFGLVFVVAGLAFKLGVVPFHMWVPDVYQGAPTAVTLLLGSAPKLAAFAVLMRVLVNGLLTQAQDWQSMLVILAVASLALGNIAAIAQKNIKRMLAYSAISHMGFMLLGIVSGVSARLDTHANPFLALNAYSSSMFYVLAYVLMTTCAFGMILLMSRAGFEADQLSDFKGLNKRNPWFAGVMLMTMFSMAGVPFFVGFFAKFAILQAVIAGGGLWLAGIAIFFSLIGAFYYLRVVKIMYFDEPETELKLQIPNDLRVLLSINGLAIAAFGLFPQWLMYVCIAALANSLYLNL